MKTAREWVKDHEELEFDDVVKALEARDAEHAAERDKLRLALEAARGALEKIGATASLVWGDGSRADQCQACGWRTDSQMCGSLCSGRIARRALTSPDEGEGA